MSNRAHSAPAARPSARTLRRAALALAVAGALPAFATHAAAQDVPSQRALEIRPFTGAYVPTGDQRDLLRDAVVVGAQASYRFRPEFALTATFGWSPSEDRITAGDQTLDLLQYDVGAELRAPAWYDAGMVTFSPFVGLGVGGRTYSYRDLDAESRSNVAGYGAVGGDVGFGRWGLRLEARDYLSRFEPLTGTGDAETRNDVTLAAGLTLSF